MSGSRTTDVPDQGQASPITAREFARAADPLCPDRSAPVALGVSGGADSMALAVLARHWAGQTGRKVYGLSVDHGLRPEAFREAGHVATSLVNLGMEAVALHYTGPQPRSNIQAAARDIRYRLMADWMDERGIQNLMLAHHLEDQAETVLLRLTRGSGVDGLSAMSAVTDLNGMRLIRPLLDFPKVRLLSTIYHAGIRHVDDPGNQNSGFARVRVRKIAADLSREGLSPAKLSRTARRMARARQALEAARDSFMKQSFHIDMCGFARFDLASFRLLPEEIGLRVLIQGLMMFGTGNYPPREEKVEALYHFLLAGKAADGSARTLAGLGIVPWRGQVLLFREEKAMQSDMPLQAGEIWDRRYEIVDVGGDATGFTLGGLGQTGLRFLNTIETDLPVKVPGAARPAMPALRYEGRIISLPGLGWSDPDLTLSGAIRMIQVIGHSGADFKRTLPFSKATRTPI